MRQAGTSSLGRSLGAQLLPPLPRYRRSSALSSRTAACPSAPTDTVCRPAATWQAALKCQAPRRCAGQCLLAMWAPSTRQSPCPRSPRALCVPLSYCPCLNASVSPHLTSVGSPAACKNNRIGNARTQGMGSPGSREQGDLSHVTRQDRAQTRAYGAWGCPHAPLVSLRQVSDGSWVSSGS